MKMIVTSSFSLEPGHREKDYNHHGYFPIVLLQIFEYIWVSSILRFPLILFAVVSANTMAIRVLICERPDGSSVQKGSVAAVGSNFRSLSLSVF